MNKNIIMFYKYVEVSNPESLQKEILSFCQSNDVRGKIYIASEGINGTVCGEQKNIGAFKQFISGYGIFNDIWFKTDTTEDYAFSRIHVRVKKELVNSGLNVNPSNGGKLLSPEELLNFYEQGKDFVIVDARNWYESKIGHFRGAITPDIQNFRDWPEVVNSLEEFKDKTIVTYCTGGIRCEKASAYMVEKGFKDVYQLHGGIVNFIQQFPDTYWQGGMFVFDDRKVVEPNSEEDLKYVTECSFCSKPTSYYINCHNLDCDKIVITCHECKVQNDYCCSDQCRRSSNRRPKNYG